MRRPAIRVPPRDKRWQQHIDAWNAAVLAKNRLAELNDAAAARELVLIAAEGYGGFSAWMTVFDSHRAIRQGLIERFKGTAENCFDASFNLQSRPTGRL